MALSQFQFAFLKQHKRVALLDGHLDESNALFSIPPAVRQIHDVPQVDFSP
jgi:hypothetical protein